MLKGYEKIQLADDFSAEVNWNDNVKECSHVKFTMNGKSIVMDKQKLLGFLFALGQPSEQEQMIPQEVTRKKWWTSMLYVQTKRDLKAGDILKVPVTIALPSVSEEVIGELKQDVLKGKLTMSNSTQMPSVVGAKLPDTDIFLKAQENKPINIKK